MSDLPVPLVLIRQPGRGIYFQDLAGRAWGSFSSGDPRVCTICGVVLHQGGYATADFSQAVCPAHVEYRPAPTDTTTPDYSPANNPQLAVARQALTNVLLAHPATLSPAPAPTDPAYWFLLIALEATRAAGDPSRSAGALVRLSQSLSEARAAQEGAPPR